MIISIKERGKYEVIIYHPLPLPLTLILSLEGRGEKEGEVRELAMR
jgi:hypothetical protein